MQEICSSFFTVLDLGIFLERFDSILYAEMTKERLGFSENALADVQGDFVFGKARKKDYKILLVFVAVFGRDQSVI